MARNRVGQYDEIPSVIATKHPQSIRLDWGQSFGRNFAIDLVFTIGYGNKATVELLKSTSGMDRIQGLNQLWAEADSFAEELKFTGHFAELKKKYEVGFPTGLGASDNFSKIILDFEKEVLESPYTTRPIETVRVRSLSMQESPFRSCLGLDCSTRTYFDRALDPNYIYFTMTNSNHKSSGHATVVLGSAINKKTGLAEPVAFLDKLQNIPSQKIEVFLDSVDRSLQGLGFRLAIPTYLGKDLPGHGGLSNMEVITDFVQLNIMPRLQEVRSEFTPHKHRYQFASGYSRGDHKLEVRVFKAAPLEANVEIRPGAQHITFAAAESLSKNQLGEEFFRLKDSEDVEERLRFVSGLSIVAGLEKMGIYTRAKFFEDLSTIIASPSEQFLLRKKALMIIGASLPAHLVANFMDKFSKIEQFQVLGELKNWENSIDTNKKQIATWASIEIFKLKGLRSAEDFENLVNILSESSSFLGRLQSFAECKALLGVEIERLKKSKNLDEKLRFILSKEISKKLEDLSIYSMDRLWQEILTILKDSQEPFVIRRKAFFRYVEDIGLSSHFVFNILDGFTLAEKNQILGEVRNWENIDSKEKQGLAHMASIEYYRINGLHSAADFRSLVMALNYTWTSKDQILYSYVGPDQYIKILEKSLVSLELPSDLRREIIYEVGFGDSYWNSILAKYKVRRESPWPSDGNAVLSLLKHVEMFSAEEKAEMRREVLSWASSTDQLFQKRYQKFSELSHKANSNVDIKDPVWQFFKSLGLIDAQYSLFRAAGFLNSKGVFDLLMGLGGSLDKLDDRGRDVLRIMIESKNLDEITIQLFQSDIQRLNVEYSDRQTPLGIAVLQGNLKVLHLLQQNGATKLNADKLKDQCLEVLKMYERDVHIDGGNTDKLVNVLLTLNEVRPELLDGTILRLSKTSMFSVLEYERRNRSTLLPGNLKSLLLESLIKKSGPNEVYDYSNVTLLHYYISDPQAIRVLVKAGWDINAQRNDGSTPLHIAAEHAELESVKTLIRLGARTDIYDDEGRPAAYVAGISKELIADAVWPKVVAAIVQSGGSVLFNNAHGGDILHRAMNYGYNDLAKVLVQNGIKTDRKNVYGLTPSQVAESTGNYEGLEILKNTKRIYFPDKKELFKEVPEGSSEMKWWQWR